MKKLFLALAIALGAQTAFAANQCPEFPYDMLEEDGVRELRLVVVENNSSKLSASERKMIIETAKGYASESEDHSWEDRNNPTITEAIEYLKDSSEGGDLYVRVLRYKGRVYTQVIIYPGGNAYGLIFKAGKAIAVQQDGDVTCL